MSKLLGGVIFIGLGAALSLAVVRSKTLHTSAHTSAQIITQSQTLTFQSGITADVTRIAGGSGGAGRITALSYGYGSVGLYEPPRSSAQILMNSLYMPNPRLTTGVSRTLDAREICGAGTAQLRHWTRERDNRILRLYNLPEGPHPAYEIDHLIPLGIGGADDDANLWPQPRAVVASNTQANFTQENAEKKDRLEYRMRDLICNTRPQASDKLVKELQDAMASDWIRAYDRYMPH